MLLNCKLVTETVRGSCEHGKNKRDSVAFSRCSLGMCLDLVFVFILGFLFVGGGARLPCCNLSCMHTPWWLLFVLVLDFLCGDVPIGSESFNILSFCHVHTFLRSPTQVANSHAQEFDCLSQKSPRISFMFRIISYKISTNIDHISTCDF